MLPYFEPTDGTPERIGKVVADAFVLFICAAIVVLLMSHIVLR